MSNLRTLASLAAAASLAALAPSCGWKSDGLERLDELYPSTSTPTPTPDGGTVVDPCPMPDDETLSPVADSGECADGLTSGRWAVRMVQFGSMSPSGMGPWRITLADHFLATASADKTSLELTFCDQTSSLTDTSGKAITLGRTSMSDGTRSAIGAATLSLALPVSGPFAATDVAWLWGLKNVTNPATDTLPTEASDPRVFDQDADSNPGVTVQVKSPDGERYMVRRSLWSFDEASVTARWATGKLTYAITENALGASTALLKTVAPITPRSECPSLYQMRCVDAAMTCSQLIANEKALWLDAP